MTLKLCLVSPYALSGSHPVAEHVRGTATALAARGDLVTVLAPSPSSQALRAGRRRLRALAGGETDALTALAGDPLLVAVGPAVPIRPHGRRRGAGLPIAAHANVALAVREGGFDIVHTHEPSLPGISLAALKYSPGLAAATFHATTERALNYPMRAGRASARRPHRRAVGDLAAGGGAGRRAVSRRLHVLPRGIADEFSPGPADPGRIVVEWTSEARAVVRALIKLTAEQPGIELSLLWSRGGRRPLRPYVPAAARGRVHALRAADTAERADALRTASVFVSTPGGSEQLAAEARASGCAVVAAGSPPMPAVSYGADQPALAPAAVARLLEDDSLRERLAVEGVEGARSQRFDAIAEQLDTLYGDLRARRRPLRRTAAPAPEIMADLHMHTSHSYDCATDVEELLDHCIAEGLGAVAITDHNEISGAVEAASLGKPITVIVGEEVMTSQGEVIGLFLHERIERGMSMADTIAAIRDQDGLVYMPHPFDRLHTIPDPATLIRSLEHIDVFEVYNSRLLRDSFNDDALRFASKYNMVQGAGSDAHVLQGIGTALNRIPAFDGAEEFLVSMRHNRIERRPKSLLYLQSLKWMHQVGRSGTG